MATHHRRLILLSTLLLFNLLHHTSLAIHSSLKLHKPLQYKIAGKQTQCIYDNFLAKDVVTLSVFVVEALNNGKPKASISFEGPVAGNKDILPPRSPSEDGGDGDNTNQDDELSSQSSADNPNPNPNNNNGKMTTGRSIQSAIRRDWPKIKAPHSPMEVYERKFKVDWTHAGESEDAAAARAFLLQKNHEEHRLHRLETRRNKEENNNGNPPPPPPPPMHTVAQASITPYEETNEIMAHGWYRLCVTSDFMPLIVEMDMRSANQMRGIHPGTGHVYTHTERQYADEQQLFQGMEEGTSFYDTNDGHEPVKVKDLRESTIKLAVLHDVTSEIMKSQHEKMHRIRTHDADARRGAAELAWSSKFETVLYVIIMGVQVYTVHKWLLSKSLLGQ
ncbi:hypothetical protein ACHAXR_005597 [Thalassiosira sp. AJA248-18]